MKEIRFPTYNISQGDSIEIVKNHLDDPNIAEKSKALAIENVINMATHNSISKADLINCLRWIFTRFDLSSSL
mgnify:FL=1